MQNIEWVRRYAPLDSGEQQALLAQGRGDRASMGTALRIGGVSDYKTLMGSL